MKVIGHGLSSGNCERLCLGAHSDAVPPHCLVPVIGTREGQTVSTAGKESDGIKKNLEVGKAQYMSAVAPGGRIFTND